MSKPSWYIEFNIPQTVTGTTTTATTIGDLPTFLTNPAPRVDDPIVVVEYESWMFFEATHLSVTHLNEVQNLVVRNALVENAILHARGICEVIVGGSPDLITLPKLFPDLTDKEKYKALKTAKKELIAVYTRANGKRFTYRELFQTRVMHPTVSRGDHGLYEEPLHRLHPKILTVIDEIARLRNHPFRRMGIGPDPSCDMCRVVKILP